jgi:hypothetical protein
LILISFKEEKVRRDARCPFGHFLNTYNGAEPKFYDGEWHFKASMGYVDEKWAQEHVIRSKGRLDGSFLRGGGWWIMCPKCAFECHQEGVQDEWKRVTWEEHLRNKLVIRNIELRPMWSDQFIMKAGG